MSASLGHCKRGFEPENGIVTTPTQSNLTKVGFDTKMSLHTTHRELNVGNVSAVTYPIWTKIRLLWSTTTTTSLRTTTATTTTIFHILLTWFLPNFKTLFLNPQQQQQKQKQQQYKYLNFDQILKLGFWTNNKNNYYNSFSFFFGSGI